MELNWIAIIVVSVLNFALGALWFGPLFGNLWMKIHHGERKISEKEEKEMTQGMWKLIISEFIATFLIIIGLACLIKAIPQYSGIYTAFMVWIAFILPMIVSEVIWGGDKKSWMPTKIALSSTYRLISLLAAGYTLSIWL